MRKNGKEMVCQICGKSKHVRQSQLDRGIGKFCSKVCQGISLRGTNISEEQKEKLRNCKRTSESRIKYSLSKLGSKNPQWHGGKINKHCLVCNKEISANRSREMIRHFCSKECQGKYQQGESNPNWNGGEMITWNGYKQIRNTSHPFNNNGYVKQHRLVVEELMGRYLNPNEEVHHVNKIKTDNRPENLMVFSSKSAHIRFHSLKSVVKKNEIVFDGRKI
jgi:endogenous inhibitor of DNA gyrase (YacG/DUF329 family)